MKTPGPDRSKDAAKVTLDAVRYAAVPGAGPAASEAWRFLEAPLTPLSKPGVPGRPSPKRPQRREAGVDTGQRSEVSRPQRCRVTAKQADPLREAAGGGIQTREAVGARLTLTATSSQADGEMDGVPAARRRINRGRGERTRLRWPKESKRPPACLPPSQLTLTRVFSLFPG